MKFFSSYSYKCTKVVGKSGYDDSMPQVSRQMQVGPEYGFRPQVSRQMQVVHAYPLSRLSVHHLLRR